MKTAAHDETISGDETGEMNTANIAFTFKKMAERIPDSKAVVVPSGRKKGRDGDWNYLTFKELEHLSDRYAYGFEEAGIRKGVKTILMVKPGIDFFGIMLALFKVGAVPVVVDPGMGLRRMLHCLAESRAEAFIGIPLANAIRTLFPSSFKTVKTAVTVGRRWFWGGTTAKQMRRRSWQSYPIAEPGPDSLGMIAFTTGSTGPAKGVIFTHRMMNAQIQSLKKEYQVGAGEVGLHTFPVFALFDCCLGATSVVPDMDPQKPAKVNPKNVIEPMLTFKATYMFGSPALVRRVGRFGEKQGVEAPAMKRVLTAGAPVAPLIIRRFLSMLPEDADVYTPYGATEALPVSTMSGRKILMETDGENTSLKGVCVGRPVHGTEIRLIRITDEPISNWSDDLSVAAGEVGEIVVCGPQVSPGYYERPDEDLSAKVIDGGKLLHRMGDVGWQDQRGQLWICGRKKQRVVTRTDTLYTIPCEAVFNRHPKVYRSALVGIGSVGAQKPVICIELKKGVGLLQRKPIREELLSMAQENRMTREITTVLFHRRFPVDIRHNAKIFRELLTVWAEDRVNERG